MDLYTTKLDTKSDFYQRNKSKAEALARAIEAKGAANTHQAEERGQLALRDNDEDAGDADEEDRFSGVARATAPSAAADSKSESTGKAKYVPPHLRSAEAPPAAAPAAAAPSSVSSPQPEAAPPAAQQPASPSVASSSDASATTPAKKKLSFNPGAAAFEPGFKISFAPPSIPKPASPPPPVGVVPGTTTTPPYMPHPPPPHVLMGPPPGAYMPMPLLAPMHPQHAQQLHMHQQQQYQHQMRLHQQQQQLLQQQQQQQPQQQTPLSPLVAAQGAAAAAAPRPASPAAASGVVFPTSPGAVVAPASAPSSPAAVLQPAAPATPATPAGSFRDKLRMAAAKVLTENQDAPSWTPSPSSKAVVANE